MGWILAPHECAPAHRARLRSRTTARSSTARSARTRHASHAVSGNLTPNVAHIACRGQPAWVLLPPPPSTPSSTSFSMRPPRLDALSRHNGTTGLVAALTRISAPHGLDAAGVGLPMVGRCWLRRRAGPRASLLAPKGAPWCLALCYAHARVSSDAPP